MAVTRNTQNAHEITRSYSRFVAEVEKHTLDYANTFTLILFEYICFDSI